MLVGWENISIAYVRSDYPDGPKSKGEEILEEYCKRENQIMDELVASCKGDSQNSESLEKRVESLMILAELDLKTSEKLLVRDYYEAALELEDRGVRREKQAYKLLFEKKLIDAWKGLEETTDTTEKMKKFREIKQFSNEILVELEAKGFDNSPSDLFWWAVIDKTKLDMDAALEWPSGDYSYVIQRVLQKSLDPKLPLQGQTVLSDHIEPDSE